MSRIYTTFTSSYILISRLLSENVGSKQKPVCQHQPEVQKLTEKILEKMNTSASAASIALLS